MLSGKEPLTLSAAKAKQTGLERMVWSKGAGQLRPCEPTGASTFRRFAGAQLACALACI
jgi:hypothetical protein